MNILSDKRVVSRWAGHKECELDAFCFDGLKIQQVCRLVSVSSFRYVSSCAFITPENQGRIKFPMRLRHKQEHYGGCVPCSVVTSLSVDERMSLSFCRHKLQISWSGCLYQLLVVH